VSMRSGLADCERPRFALCAPHATCPPRRGPCCLVTLPHTIHLHSLFLAMTRPLFAPETSRRHEGALLAAWHRGVVDAVRCGGRRLGRRDVFTSVARRGSGRGSGRGSATSQQRQQRQQRQRSRECGIMLTRVCLRVWLSCWHPASLFAGRAPCAVARSARHAERACGQRHMARGPLEHDRSAVAADDGRDLARDCRPRPAPAAARALWAGARRAGALRRVGGIRVRGRGRGAGPARRACR